MQNRDHGGHLGGWLPQHSTAELTVFSSVFPARVESYFPLCPMGLVHAMCSTFVEMK